MTAESRDRIIALLARQQPKAVLGTPESEWVDFKTAGPNGRTEEVRTEGAIRRRRVTGRSRTYLTQCDIRCGDMIMIISRV
ncbi:hypothetical protein ACFYZ5_44195 [Streptomyces chartreusis]|uniref:hypothetical protein n=1 Tax=Streptomyces chartreusis TaxID=1969 RepID=UPI00368899EB